MPKKVATLSHGHLEFVHLGGETLRATDEKVSKLRLARSAALKAKLSAEV